MSKKQTQLRIDYDGKWKTLIERAPKQFIDFFLSEIYPLVDFQYPPKFLQQDVAKIIGSKRKKGDVITDVIMEINLLDGTKKMLYIHIEVQSGPTTSFGEKMFKPFYRLKDKYDQEVTALALFVGEYLPKNHDHYEYRFGKTVVRYEYPTYIVKGQEKAALKASENPFSIAVLACLYLMETKKKELHADRLALKKELVNFIIEAAIEHNFDEMTTYAIISFVANVMILPEELEEDFNDYCQEKFIKMEDREVLSKSMKGFANAFAMAFFKESYTEVIERLKASKDAEIAQIKAETALAAAQKEIEKAMAAKLEAEKAAKLEAEKAAIAAKLEAEKAVIAAKLEAEKAAKMKTESFILTLHKKQQYSIAEIADLVGEKETYVKAVLAKKKK